MIMLHEVVFNNIHTNIYIYIYIYIYMKYTYPYMDNTYMDKYTRPLYIPRIRMRVIPC